MDRRIAAILSLDVAGFSQMMEANTDGTVRQLNQALRTVVRPAIKQCNGTVVKLMGDSVLAEFAAAGDAIGAAHIIQTEMQNSQVRLRAGVHVGDITSSGSDIFGDAINIATRLQSVARAGNGLVSRMAADLAGGGLGTGIVLKREGALRLKGIADPVEALSFDVTDTARQRRASQLEQEQDIRFARSRDGVRLAWTAIGEGPVLVKAPNWISHLELDWTSLNGGWLTDLAQNYRLIRFDQRGNGLSDRDVTDISLEHFVDDLEAVFDAAGVERAPLFCKSQGAAIGAAFAVRCPERVSGIVALGAFREGPLVRAQPRHVEMTAALDAMARVGWDDEYPSVRDHFASVLAPDASPDDQRSFAEKMLETISAQEFSRFRESVGKFDVSEILPNVQCPALVMHGTGDRLHPIEQGRRFAASIPDSRFVALPSRNHILPSYDPAWPMAQREIQSFLSEVNGTAN